MRSRSHLLSLVVSLLASFNARAVLDDIDYARDVRPISRAPFCLSRARRHTP
jgi:hypothetical protein